MADEQDAAVAAIDEEPAFDAPERGSADELLDAGAHAPIDAMRHSTAHVMAEAVLDLFPATQLGIGPAIQDGFYYDFKLDRPLTPADLAKIEERMAASIAAGSWAGGASFAIGSTSGRNTKPLVRAGREVESSRGSTRVRVFCRSPGLVALSWPR